MSYFHLVDIIVGDAMSVLVAFQSLIFVTVIVEIELVMYQKVYLTLRYEKSNRDSQLKNHKNHVNCW